jgi:protocatechuate 3,4-dioxygenase beta subunit
MNHDHELEDHDRGLALDIARLLNRRRLLSLAAAGAGAAVLAACGGGDDAATATSAAGTTGTTAGTTGTADTTASSSTASTSSTSTTGASCTEIPEETAGPYPGDGSNGPNALAESGVVRSDIRSSFGSASGVADGVPLTFELAVTDTTAGCAPLAGAAVYAWHCDREGRYSMYSEGAENENYLRGVQETDADGKVTFTSTFPACYAGRWPHIHFEIYASVDEATAAGDPVATSQLAFPEDVCQVVYATDGYSQSVQNLSQVSLESDMVFGDGYTQQMASIDGSVEDGYTATLTVPV